MSETSIFYDRDTSKDLIYDEETGQYRSANQYFSKFSDGTNTYIVKDAEARSSLANKQDTLVSGTNIKTINNNSLLGSGNITLDSLPSQSGNSGKFLTTNGSAASWATVSIPTVDQTYNASSANAQSGVAVASAISSAISSVYKPAGSVTFASLPTPSSSNEGNVYNVTDSFTTTSDFVEGAGNSYPAGTNVVIVESNQTYYAWGIENHQGQIIGPYVYTLSVTPTTGDDVFEYNNNIFEDYGNVSSFSNNVLHFMYWAGKSDDYYRASSADVSGNVPSYYFDVLAGFIDLSGYQATLVSGTNIKTINSNSILGSGNLDIDALPSQTNNSGKFLTTNGTTASWGNVTIPFGESTSAADAVQKEVTISEITELKTGQIIIVKPTITSTVADATLKLNNFTAYPILYGAAAITTSTDSITWAANYPSWFRFDGSNWVFLGHGVDNNTTYSAMSVSEGTTGTKTTARSVRADYLKQIIQGTTLTGLSTSTNSAVVATDTITTGIGKLQAQVNNKVDKTSIATTSTAGLVKPDGTSITIDSNGTISASAGAYAMVIVDYTAEEE